jgi:hypothetical protein
MKIIDGLIGGLAGAISVTLLHELTRKIYKGAPRLDLLGEQATAKAIGAVTGNTPDENKLYGAALAGDLAANALYYGFSAANAKNPFRTATILGISAGLGAITVPSKIGLSGEHAAATTERKLVTLALYTIGGMVTGMVMNMLKAR